MCEALFTIRRPIWSKFDSYRFIGLQKIVASTADKVFVLQTFLKRFEKEMVGNG